MPFCLLVTSHVSPDSIYPISLVFYPCRPPMLPSLPRDQSRDSTQPIISNSLPMQTSIIIGALRNPRKQSQRNAPAVLVQVPLPQRPAEIIHSSISGNNGYGLVTIYLNTWYYSLELRFL